MSTPTTTVISGVKEVFDSGDKTTPDQWIRTRMCFCDTNAETDCRFHSTSEKGWEVCPNLSLAKAGSKLGRWLWARNPNYSKISPAAEESLKTETEAE